jgi:DnaJ family protein B protein 4
MEMRLQECLIVYNNILFLFYFYFIIANLIVSIKEEYHPKFKRTNQGKDLIYTHTISLIEALKSEPVEVNSLDDRKLIITMDEIISPQTIKLIKGEGMPIYNKEDPIKSLLFREIRGDLYLKFNIIFPKFIDPEKKEEIINLLDD